MLWRAVNLGVLLGFLSVMVLFAIDRPIAFLGTLAIIASIMLAFYAFDSYSEGRRRPAIASTIAILGLLVGIAIASPLAAISFVIVVPLIWALHRFWGGQHERTRSGAV